MNRIISDREYANLLQQTQPNLYNVLREAVEKGVPRDGILYMLRRTVDEAKSPEDPQAGELTYGIAEATVEYFLSMARQIEALGLGEGA
jgi:hypothetical protein